MRPARTRSKPRKMICPLGKECPLPASEEPRGHNPPGQVPFGLGLRCALGRVSRGYTPRRAPRPRPKGTWQTVFYPGVWSVSGLSIALIIMVLGRACSKRPPRARGNGPRRKGGEIRNPKSEIRTPEGGGRLAREMERAAGFNPQARQGRRSRPCRSAGEIRRACQPAGPADHPGHRATDLRRADSWR